MVDKAYQCGGHAGDDVLHVADGEGGLRFKGSFEEFVGKSDCVDGIRFNGQSGRLIYCQTIQLHHVLFPGCRKFPIQHEWLMIESSQIEDLDASRY